jgi:FMN phosphatase YigB (HAD superfamily)
MKARAVIFDVYGTLLEVSSPPADASTSWARLWRACFDSVPRLTLEGFSTACAGIIAREHGVARERGILFPEVCWPAVVAEAMPELAGLSPEARDEFLFQQTKLWHTVRLATEAPALLRALRQTGCVLGIASNAQAYTLRELREALAAHGLGLDLFDRPLCFWSFEHGFSKPDPHVFRILNARLTACGIHPQETIMVGDRLDSDIQPAKALGWHAWQLGPQGDGDWAALGQWLHRGQEPSTS